MYFDQLIICYTLYLPVIFVSRFDRHTTQKKMISIITNKYSKTYKLDTCKPCKLCAYKYIDRYRGTVQSISN